MQVNPKTSATNKSQTVLNQLDLLRRAAKDPASIHEPLRSVLTDALRSQGGLSTLSIPGEQIAGMSLNTHKAIANACLDGGYETLNQYRKVALERLNASQSQVEKPGRGTLNWYKSENTAKNEELAMIRNEVAEMSLRLDEVLSLAYQMAKAAGKEAEFSKRRNEILRKFKS